MKGTPAQGYQPNTVHEQKARTPKIRRPRFAFWCARHGQQLGGERPLRARQQEALAKGKASIVRWDLKEAGCQGEELWRANSRTDEQKSHSRPYRDGRVCDTTQSPMLPESHTVNVAVTWEERCYSYPGRSCRREVGNPKAAVTTNCKKSAEAIVP